MASILEALQTLAGDPAGKATFPDWLQPAVRKYLSTGDPKDLAKIASFKKNWVPSEFIQALGPPASLDPEGQRFLRICLTQEIFRSFSEWLLQLSDRQPATFDAGVKLLRDMGASHRLLAAALGSHVLARAVAPDSPAGRFLLGLPEEDLFQLMADRNDLVRHPLRLMFGSHAPEPYARILARLLANPPAKVDVAGLVIEFLELHPGEHLALAETALAKAPPAHRFSLLQHLVRIDPKRYGPVVDEAAAALLPGSDPWCTEKEIAEWLVQHRPQTCLGPVQAYLASPLRANDWARKVGSEYKNEVLDAAATHLGERAVPLYEACFKVSQPEVQLRALKHWIALGRPEDRAAITGRFRELLASDDNPKVARAARLAGEFAVEALEPELWALLAHKSRPVREAAGVTLARLGDARLGKADELWQAKKADTRLAAVGWLRSLGTPAATAALRARLEDEADEDVRDALLLTLEKLTGKEEDFDPAELKRRIRKAAANLADRPTKWLDPAKLPPAKMRNGKKLDLDALRYLLYRQSRVKEMRPDIEARPLFAQLERSSAGDLALAVLQGYFGSKANADDRWTMAFSAIVGDDRLVPVFTRQIKEWADNMRGKLAEYAVQALALLGTDAALLAVDAMSIRYRSRNKNIGKAASDAFAAAAQARGLTVEELGDLVVPWLGFEPGQPRVVDTGKARLEVRIGNDFKLAFRDLATHKKVAKLPDSAPTALKNEFKDMAAGLKEAVKSQLLRLETLMVRQFRWPAPRWRELYLQHPLLIPFAQRLVWGHYDGANRLIATCRALEDLSLTDAADAPLAMPAEGQMGIVHPLELTPETRQAWLRHLADYSVVPPFDQIERTVVLASAQQKETRFGRDVDGRELNAMTFRGRAEKLGWSRGSVCDAGGIGFYLKRFPVAGVDVFVETDGMFVGIDMYTDIKLGKVFFVRAGSVKIGSYEYDEPADEQDPRLVPFGAVPAIAFSEAIGDVIRIAGGKESASASDEN